MRLFGIIVFERCYRCRRWRSGLSLEDARGGLICRERDECAQIAKHVTG